MQSPASDRCQLTREISRVTEAAVVLLGSFAESASEAMPNLVKAIE